MIAHLNGTLVEALPTRVLVDVGGVGYEVWIPLSTFDRLPAPSSQVRLFTHLQVREDEHALFGFITSEERDLFRLLVCHVTGIGPRLALAVLSAMRPPDFRQAVVSGDVASLSRIKGLGRKTAERIVLELRDKVGVSQAWAAGAQPGGLSPELQMRHDALLALIALGYKEVEASKALERVSADHRGSVEEWIRLALRQI